jgi:L-rhamnose 1-dehydrogenase
MNRRFEGKVALVTGGSRGIGRAICNKLAAGGAKVAVNYSSAADAKFPGASEKALEIVRSYGIDGMLLEADVSDSSAVRHMVDKTIERFGGIDILVNNAGICPMLEFFDITEEIWDRVHAVNLKGVFLCTQAVARTMVDQKRKGRIICISSIASIVGTPTQIHYCPTKSGINMFVKSLASVLTPLGITVNAVIPGDIETDISREWDEANPEEIQRYIDRCPARRRGQPEDIAAVVAFLASDEASFVSGSLYLADGGISAVM